VITPTLAYATNESSYLVGYQQATHQYPGCTIIDPGGSEPGCPDSDAAIYSCYKGETLFHTSETVTNVTACMDGYVNGFNHYCKEHVKDCAENTINGNIPTYGINHNKTAIKLASSNPQSKLVGTWNFVNESSGTTGTMIFDLTTSDDWHPAGGFNQTIGGKLVGLGD
jgi:hypothetical protein